VKLVAGHAAARPLRPHRISRRYITFGASPRATIHLIEGARALRFLRGREYVLPEDVTDLVPDVLRHRLVLSYEALSDAKTADELVRGVMKAVPAPGEALGNPCPSRRG
jgi:MoxR-like ATPase